MERTSVNLETLRDIPGYRVILKTVLHSQIQQLVEQLSKHTEEEVVFLTASLGDGTISHIGSSVGKEFLQKNDEVKSKFLAFCLKRHHEISTSQLSKQPKSQGQGPVPVKLTGRPVTPRHSPYANSSARHRNSKRQSRSTTSGQSNSGANESTASENDRKILESVSIELADADDNDYTEEFDVTANESTASENDRKILESVSIELADADDNDYTEEFDVTDNEGLSDLDEGQKWDEITSETTTGKVHPIEGADAVQESAAEVESFHNYDNTNADVGLDISQNFTGNIDTESVISVKVESVHTDTGDALQLGVGLDSPSISGLAPSSQSVSGASGSYTALQDDMLEVQEEIVMETHESNEPGKKTTFVTSKELERKPSQYVKKNGRYCCDECHYTSKFTHNLRKHYWMSHQREEYKPTAASPRFKKKKGLYHCEYCPFTTKFSPSLNQHINGRHKNVTYECGLCTKSYSNPYNLKEHITCVHENKKITCEFCSRLFNTRSSLYGHLRKKHGAKRSEQAKNRQ